MAYAARYPAPRSTEPVKVALGHYPRGTCKLLSFIITPLAWNERTELKFKKVKSIMWLDNLELLLRMVVFGLINVPYVILVRLVQKITLVVAMALPLKAVIMLEGVSTPSYFPAFMRAIPHEHLIILIGCTALLAYGSHLALKSFAPKGEKKAQARFDSFRTPDSSSHLVPSAYRWQNKIGAAGQGAADFMFFVISILVVGLIYPLLFWLEIVALVMIYSRAVGLQLRGNPRKLVWKKIRQGGSVSTTFLAAISALILSHLFWGGPNLLVMIVSLLMLRQGLSSLLKSAELASR